MLYSRIYRLMPRAFRLRIRYGSRIMIKSPYTERNYFWQVEKSDPISYVHAPEFFSCFEPCTYEILRKVLIDGGGFLNVGAHTGSWLLRCFDFNSNLELIGVEPHPHTFNRLFKNMKINKINAKLLNFAAGEALGFSSIYEHEGLDALNTLVPSIGVEPTQQEVPMIPLDLFRFRGLSLILIDVEGYEWEVIQGLKETLRINSPVLVVEILSETSLTNLNDLLSQYGYSKGLMICDGNAKCFLRQERNFVFYPTNYTF